jgi:iron(III) transport system substrate-binding protein
MRLLPFPAVPLLAVLAAGCAPSAPPVDDRGELVVYSERKESLIEPIFARYTRETGVRVRWLTDAAPVLIERIAAEGASTRADLLMTVDAGSLWQAAERGLLRPLESEQLEAVVPAHLRDPQSRWFGLSQRARTIVYSTERVDPAELSSYAALADERWRGRLCLRSSRKVYNQSLTASLIERYGEEAAETVVAGWVANLATAPFADDTLLAQAIRAGQCDVGIINTYYLGRLQKDDPEFPVQLFWADQEHDGVHVNISGAGVLAGSSRPEQAQALLEWLVSADVQGEFAALNLEFPVRAGIALDPVVDAWAEYRPDPLNVEVSGRRQAEAVRLMDRVGWR